MATVTITGNTIRGATASKDNRTWQIRAVAYQYGGTGGGVITPGADWETLYPVDGVLTFTAESGSVVDIKTPEGVPYRVRIPTGNAGLWDTIEAGVAYQPDVAQDTLNRAVANAAPGFIAAELGLQTADAITTDLDGREIGFVDVGEGEGYFTITSPDGETVNISGTLVPPAATWSGVAGRPLVAAFEFGATGDGTTDDTEALQNWLDYVVEHHACGWLPNGTYKITDTLVANPSPLGYTIQGEHSNLTIIKQFTDNIPVLQIGTEADSTRKVTLENFALTYDSEQSASDTNANNLVFMGPGGGASSLAYCSFRHLVFTNGYYCMRVPAGKVAPWACEFDMLYMQRMSGGFYDNTGSIGGVPNNKWGRLTLYCDDAVGPIFKAWNTYNTTVGTIEFLRADAGPVLINAVAGFGVDFDSIKLELGSYTTAGHLVQLPSAHWVHVTDFVVDLGTNINPASGTFAAFGLLAASGPEAYLEVGTLRMRATTLSGNCVGFASGGTYGGKIRVGNVELSNGWTLHDRAGTPVGDYLTVDTWVNGRLSTDKGDADYTVTLGDPNVVNFNTPFTAPRTITLPSQTSNNTCAGLYYDLAFDGAINGANTAVIKQGSTTLRTQTADKRVLHYKWRRSTWVLVGVTEYNVNAAAQPIEVTETLDFGEVAAKSNVEITLTVPGVLGGVYRPIALGIPVPSNTAGLVYTAVVSANDSVMIRANNYTDSPINPDSGPFTIYVFPQES